MVAIDRGKLRVRGGARVRWQSLALLAAVAGAAGLALTRSNERPTQAAPKAPGKVVSRHPEVVTQVVSTGSLQQALRVTGTLKSNETVKISTKAIGLVKEVLVEEGEQVRQGQLLVLLDDRELQAQRANAQAAVRAAEANVEAAEANRRAAEAKLSQAGTTGTVKNASAQAQFHQAEQELEAARVRATQAKARAGIEGTQADTRVASARASLQAAKERVKVLNEGARRQETAQAQAAVAQAQAQVNKVKAIAARRRQLQARGYVAPEEAENAMRDYQVAVAALHAAQQQLELVQEGPRTEEIRIAEEAVRQAQAALDDATANQARRGISNDDIETAQAQVRQAEAALVSARAGLGQREISTEEVRTARAALNQAEAAVSQARAAVSQAQAQVRNLDAQLAQTRVTSPVNGVVAKRSIHVGEATAMMNNELMTVVASDTLFLEATASETALPYLRQGAPAAVALDALPGRTFPGTVREVIRVTEGDTRSMRLRISVTGAAQAGVVGGFARATIQGRTERPVVTVPRGAVVTEGGQPAVFVVKDSRAHRRPVRIGATSSGQVEVFEGLQVGEEVVTEDALRLEDGLQVQVKR